MSRSRRRIPSRFIRNRRALLPWERGKQIWGNGIVGLAAKMIPGVVFLVVILGWHTDLNRGKVAKCACISSRSVVLFNVS